MTAAIDDIAHVTRIPDGAELHLCTEDGEVLVLRLDCRAALSLADDLTLAVERPLRLAAA